MKHRWRQLLLLLPVVLFLCLAASAESPAEQFPYEETIWAHFDEWFAGISPEDKAKFHIVSADSFHNADYGTMTEVCLQYSEISNINLSILFTEEGEPILLWPNDYHAKALAVLHEQPISEEMAWAFFRSYYDQFAADPGIASAAYEAYLADGHADEPLDFDSQHYHLYFSCKETQSSDPPRWDFLLNHPYPDDTRTWLEMSIDANTGEIVSVMNDMFALPIKNRPLRPLGLIHDVDVEAALWELDGPYIVMDAQTKQEDIDGIIERNGLTFVQSWQKNEGTAELYAGRMGGYLALLRNGDELLCAQYVNGIKSDAITRSNAGDLNLHAYWSSLPTDEEELMWKTSYLLDGTALCIQYNLYDPEDIRIWRITSESCIIPTVQ